MKPEQPDLLPEGSGPAETFVRFDGLDAFYARCRAEHTRCIIQSLDRKRHGYVCVAVPVDRPRVSSPESVQKFLKM